MNILHLSDIHFGRNNPKYKVAGEFQHKEKILEELLESIGETRCKPEHIVVTGDVAWWGRKQDFDEALVWFKKLLKITNLSGKDITFCPGNHDVNWSYGNANRNMTPENIEMIDEMYQYDKIHEFEAPLYNYEKFCEQLEVAPFHYLKEGQWEASYSIGHKDIVLANGEIIRLVSFNTALLSYVPGYPDDQMMIGQKQVFDLIKYGILGDSSIYFTIALFHHAERFLHTHEICEYNQRKATLPLLRKYVNLILCGHTETGGMPVINQQIGGSEMLTGGAAYYTDDHANAYSIIIVPDSCNGVVQKTIVFDSYIYSEDQGWHINKAKELTNTEAINTKIPKLNIRADLKLVLFNKDQEFTVPIKDISVSDFGVNEKVINNSEDVCRYLDIECIGPTNKPGNAKLSIKTASRKANNVGAFLAREGIFGFIENALRESQLTFKFFDEFGQDFMSGDLSKTDCEIKQEGYDFLKKVRRIEEYYDVLFRRPDDSAQEGRVDVINELIEYGFTKRLNIIQTATIPFSDRNQLLKIGKSRIFHTDVYLYCKNEFRCNLYGCDFSLGEAKVIAGPYRVDRSGNILKALTYQNGDIRRVKLIAKENTECYLVTNEGKINFHNKRKRKNICIRRDNLGIDWGYIYEIKKKKAFKEEKNQSGMVDCLV
ncbi:MAG: metallophosphoesterase [Lachnospiraceae bacterium]|nr:metallophosphoesterase [Lachnospiraceae bacterium]